MSYRLPLRGLGGPVDDLAQEVSSYAASLMQDEARVRIPILLNELRPEIRATAKDAFSSVMTDEQVKAMLGETTTKVAYVGVAACVGTAVLTWFLVKYADI